MPTIKCPQCQASLKVSEGQEAFACPKCKKSLRIKSRSRSSFERAWHLRHLDGNEYGPYTDAEVITYAAESRIVGSSEMNHFKHTNGTWLSADAIPFIASKLSVCPPPPIQAPPIASKPPAYDSPPHPFTADHFKSTGPHGRRPSKRWAFPWLLLCIWGIWTLGMAFFFGVGILSYDRLDLKNDVVVAGGRVLSSSTWITRHLFGTFILSVVFGVPAFILSVILYFFFPKPSNEKI